MDLTFPWKPLASCRSFAHAQGKATSRSSNIESGHFISTIEMTTQSNNGVKFYDRFKCADVMTE